MVSNLETGGYSGFNCRVSKTYPICSNSVGVCYPEATSFGDECGVYGCKKVS